METAPSPRPDNSKRKVRLYFTIAFIFFVAMALFWSVDISVVYIFLGAGSFFLFLGFYNNTIKKSDSGQFKKSYQQEKKDFEAELSLADVLGKIFQRKKPDLTADPKLNVQVPGRKFAVVIALSFFIIFITTVLVAIFSSDSESYDAMSFYSKAEQHYLSQEYDSASVNYRRALQLDPENEEAMLGYGNVLVVRNERDSAIIMFDKALEINPEYKEASFNKAYAFYDQKKYNEGIALLTSLIDTNPEYYDAMVLMGDFYYIQKKYDDAITWYENAYQNGGMRSRMLCHIMAFIYDTKGQYDKAIGLYQEALTYDSSIVEIYQRLGELIPGEDGNGYRAKAVQMKQ